MERDGVSVYLLLLDPASLEVLWANDNAEEIVIERSGRSAVGLSVSEVIPFAEALGVPGLLGEVAVTGETRELHSLGFSVKGEQTRTSASMYRLPSGQLLLASEYQVGAPS